MHEQFAKVGDVELCYETFGDPGDPALLLVMGLATQMVAWHEDFCRQLVDRGFFVIRYDNRDVGRSTHFRGTPPPTVGQMLRRKPKHVAYTLDDMAADAAGLLDHLGIERAHVVGASMGGMIAQTLAARYPDRVLSLVSIMSNTGDRWRGQPSPRVYPFFLSAPPKEREAYVERIVKLFGVVGSRGLERDERQIRDIAEQSYERGLDPGGTGRQMAAIQASGDRTAALRAIRAPTLVIHGTRDPLVRPSGGKATARAIPGAKLMMVEGMGHDMPRVIWPRLIDAIVQNTERAATPAAA